MTHTKITNPKYLDFRYKVISEGKLIAEGPLSAFRVLFKLRNEAINRIIASGDMSTDLYFTGQHWSKVTFTPVGA